MKYLLSLSAVLISLSITAQSKWSVGLIGGVDLSNVKRDRDVTFTDPNSPPLDEIYKPSIQLRYGFNISYALNAKFAIKSGVRVNSQGTQSSFNATDLRWGHQHNGQGGFDPTIDPINPFDFNVLTIKNRNKFLEVPLHIVYTKGNGQWKWFIEGGISPNIYLTSTAVRRADGEKATRDSRRLGNRDFRQFTSSIDVGFGLHRMLNDRLNLSIQPMFRFYPQQISTAEEYLFKAYYYNFGVEVGASCSLGQ